MDHAGLGGVTMWLEGLKERRARHNYNDGTPCQPMISIWVKDLNRLIEIAGDAMLDKYGSCNICHADIAYCKPHYEICPYSDLYNK